MAIFSTQDTKVLMPSTVADGMITKTQSTSTVAQLSGSEPQKFGDVDYIIFDSFPKAEFVEEGAQKSSTTGGFRSVRATPKKAQVTMRFNEEVQWADEDHQLDVLNQLANKGAEALSRALDLGLYHRINPLTGSVINGWDNYVTATDKSVEVGSGELDQVIREGVGLLVNDVESPVTPTGLALDPTTVWDLGNLQTKNADGTPSGVQRYPNIGLGTNLQSFLGLNTAVGNTVSGRPEAADTGVRGIIGDFQGGIRWGIQRQMWAEKIPYGDPDGQGDLAGQNQIAFRLEIVYGWYVFTDRFAVIKTGEEASGE